MFAARPCSQLLRLKGVNALQKPAADGASVSGVTTKETVETLQPSKQAADATGTPLGKGEHTPNEPDMALKVAPTPAKPDLTPNGVDVNGSVPVSEAAVKLDLGNGAAEAVPEAASADPASVRTIATPPPLGLPPRSPSGGASEGDGGSSCSSPTKRGAKSVKFAAGQNVQEQQQQSSRRPSQDEASQRNSPPTDPPSSISTPAAPLSSTTPGAAAAGSSSNRLRRGPPKRQVSAGKNGSLSLNSTAAPRTSGSGGGAAADPVVLNKQVEILRTSRGSKLRERRGGLDSTFSSMQNSLVTDGVTVEAVNTRAAGLKHIGFGPFKRENQDEFFIQVGEYGGSLNSNLFCVFDGHGTHGKAAAAYR